MTGIMDYIDFRGDLSFKISPFNEVDNYIISKIGVLDFKGIVSEDETPITIGDAMKAYFERYENGEYLGLLTSVKVLEGVRRLPHTERFKDITLSGFCAIASEDDVEQFSALTVGFPDGTHYVSFRGTDDTLNAWEENFLMAVEREIPAQGDALRYLKWAAKAYRGKLIVGGHSKGGNLAVYSSSFAPKSVQRRILAVYSNDGPGFYPEFLENEGYLRIKDRLHVILPNHSLVGTLLTQDEGLEIVDCDRTGVASHDGFNWHVRGTSFVRSEGLSRSSRAYEEGLATALDTMSMDDRRIFLAELFGAFEATGAHTLTDLNAHRVRQAAKFLVSLGKSGEARHFAYITIKEMLKELAAHGGDDEDEDAEEPRADEGVAAVAASAAKEMAIKAADAVKESAGKAAEFAMDTAEKAADSAIEAAKEVAESLSHLLGGKARKEEAEEIEDDEDNPENEIMEGELIPVPEPQS
ncbi:MAG: DUF2974 domain-containing protein [Firmicutes bacterium]|nr:DUF2974 domain-containing protein [Bacillota bacterium]